MTIAINNLFSCFFKTYVPRVLKTEKKKGKKGKKEKKSSKGSQKSSISGKEGKVIIKYSDLLMLERRSGYLRSLTNENLTLNQYSGLVIECNNRQIFRNVVSSQPIVSLST